MKKISTTTLVLAIITLLAAIALITLSVLYGAPRVSVERYGMFEMTSYRVRDASALPVIFAIVGSALMIISCNLFLFTAKAKCCKYHHKHEEVCECEKVEKVEEPEKPEAKKTVKTKKTESEEVSEEK